MEQEPLIEQELLIDYAFFRLTKEAARNLLANRAANRHINKYTVARMVDDMNNGRWVVTHQSPAVDQNGKLIDGQHRLQAFVNSNLEFFPTYIAYYNHPNRAMEVFDTMTVRSVANILQITREATFATQRAAIASAMLSLQTDAWPLRVSKSRVIAFVDTNVEAIDFGIHALPNVVAIGQASVRGALAYLFDHRPKDRERLAQFAHVLRTGFPEGKADQAAIKFRDALLTRTVGSGGGWGHGCTGTRQIAMATVNIFGYFVAGKPISRICIPK
jgi:hypothetical protein